MSIKLVPYNPIWPKQYEAERLFTLEAIGKKILYIDHIGSTSVQGLGAKTIIDIIVGVPDKKIAEGIMRVLKPLGYAHISRGDDQDPNRFCCACRVYGGVSIHLHLVKYGSGFHLKHIIFRDWLRVHPEDARRYYELELDLAETTTKSESYNYTAAIYINR
jgi:GrpB-like predicted nucleotidyltransferase (UPF0157 family)